jgi:hypothetical protein
LILNQSSQPTDNLCENVPPGGKKELPPGLAVNYDSGTCLVVCRLVLCWIALLRHSALSIILLSE